MNNVPIKILDDVEKIIKGYSLFGDKNVYVAYSGGKDSLFLCLVLRELGYEVYPIIIDIGYNSDWGIAEKNISRIGLDSTKIGIEQINQWMPEIKNELRINFENIRKIKGGSFSKATICTPCHNSKMLILQKWAEINRIQTIANGHHAVDAISSLLKSFYMYLDRWKYHHEEFVYDNFYQLIISQKNLYMLEKENFMISLPGSEIEKQIEAQTVGTDEPIMQNIGNTNIRLCRPLFGVFENAIIEYFAAQDVMFNESECFATNFRDKNRLTPRELILHELLRNAPQSLLDYLLELSKKSMDENGFLKFNARNNRTKILGNKYKDGKINIIKK